MIIYQKHDQEFQKQCVGRNPIFLYLHQDLFHQYKHGTAHLDNHPMPKLPIT